MYDVDDLGLLTRDLLRERTAALVAEVCAWSVGLSDQPHLARRSGRITPTGTTLGQRAEVDLPLGEEPEGHLELGEARPGSLADALAALLPDGRVWADRFDDEVLAPFVLATCVQACERARDERPQAWAELLDELGEDGSDLEEVVRAAEWEAPLRILAEQLALAALGDAPLVEVEAEGLPLSLVRGAETLLRAAAEPAPPSVAPPVAEADLAGALFLAEVALQAAQLEVPVRPEQTGVLLAALREQGLEPAEVLTVLPHLPVLQDTVELVEEVLRRSA